MGRGRRPGELGCGLGLCGPWGVAGGCRAAEGRGSRKEGAKAWRRGRGLGAEAGLR